jgi:hypothetical protein
MDDNGAVNVPMVITRESTTRLSLYLHTCKTEDILKVGGPKKLSSVAVQHLLPTDEKPEKLPKSTNTFFGNCKIAAKFASKEKRRQQHGMVERHGKVRV